MNMPEVKIAGEKRFFHAESMLARGSTAIAQYGAMDAPFAGIPPQNTFAANVAAVSSRWFRKHGSVRGNANRDPAKG